MDLRRFLTRRNLLTAGIILGGIVLIALIILLSGGVRREKRFTGGEDSSYPYSWIEYRDGSIAVKPYTPVLEGYSWYVDEYDEAAVKVSKTGGKKSPSFTLTPASEGDSLIRISLSESQGSVRLATISMIVEGSSSGRKTALTVTGHRIDEPEDILVGSEHGVSYLITTDDEGGLQIRVSGSGKDDWGYFVSTPRTVYAAGASHSDAAVEAGLRALRTGDAAVTVYSRSRGISLEIKAASGSNRTVRPVSCTAEKHEDWAGMEEALMLAGLLMPGVTVPEGAENVVFSAEGPGGMIGPGTVSFNYLGASWKAVSTAYASFVEMMDSEGYGTGTELRTFITQAGALYAYFEDGSNVTAWCDSENFSYFIKGTAADAAGEIDASDLIETANIVMGDN